MHGKQKESCYLCGSKRKDLHKLDADGNYICVECMRNGRTKTALDLLEHNKKVGVNHAR